MTPPEDGAHPEDGTHHQQTVELTNGQLATIATALLVLLDRVGRYATPTPVAVFQKQQRLNQIAEALSVLEGPINRLRQWNRRN